MDIHPEIQVYALEQANKALIELKTGVIQGAKVLNINYANIKHFEPWK
jgi:propanol-preferring alcohol dehydrogenase